MTATSDEATADPSERCEEARRLAEEGHLGRAAKIFEEVLALGDTPHRAIAALGLAVVRDDEGDVAGARAADEIAIATGDGEYGPRAAYHLALSYERAGEPDGARSAWLRVVDFGNPAYLPPACLALAQLADAGGDGAAATEWWERAIATDDPDVAAVAAHELAQRLLEEGEAARAQRVLRAALDGDERDPRLVASLGIAHLDLAISALHSAATAGDPDVTPLAVELLARILPLRGREDEARQVWRAGLDSEDPQIAAGVRARVRRGVGDSGPADAEAWWDADVEAAVRDNGVPALADEVFTALDRMYVLIAMRYAEGRLDLPAEDHELLGRAVRVPSGYRWGGALHASFAERLRHAMGTDEQVLPRDWPGEDEFSG